MSSLAAIRRLASDHEARLSYVLVGTEGGYNAKQLLSIVRIGIVL